MYFQFGGFLKWGTPKSSILFYEFQYKTSIKRGTPILGHPHSKGPTIAGNPITDDVCNQPLMVTLSLVSWITAHCHATWFHELLEDFVSPILLNLVIPSPISPNIKQPNHDLEGGFTHIWDLLGFLIWVQSVHAIRRISSVQSHPWRVLGQTLGRWAGKYPVTFLCGWVDSGNSTVMPMWFLGLCLCGFLGLMKKTHVF